MIVLNEIFEPELYQEIINSVIADVKPNQIILEEGTYIDKGISKSKKN